MTQSEQTGSISVRGNDAAHLAQTVRRVQVDAFVRHHFSGPGSLRLHGAAVGLDLLRAPANVMLSPILVLTRLLAWICGRFRLRGFSGWLRRRRLLLRTSVAARVETLILSELLEVPLPRNPGALTRDALTRAILAAPGLRASIREIGSVSAAETMANRIMDAVVEYSGTRSAMAEVTTALLMLVTGAVIFQALTPGAISMAPDVAEQLARGAAIGGFPLGSTLGEVWYGIFPVGPSGGLFAVTIAGLVLMGAVVATFAGLIADPIQTRLGMHQRRLMRLVQTVDAEIGRLPERPFVAREHFIVRVFDLWDAALSLFRVFRG